MAAPSTKAGVIPKQPRMLAACLVVAFACGCGAGSSSSRQVQSHPSGPHGGPAVPLPGDVGFAEVTIEHEPADGAGDRARVVVYFFQKDMRTALSPPPSDVAVQLLSPDGPAQAYTLTPLPKNDDPIGGTRFASQPATVAIDEPVGELTVNLGGQSTKLPFASVR